MRARPSLWVRCSDTSQLRSRPTSPPPLRPPPLPPPLRLMPLSLWALRVSQSRPKFNNLLTLRRLKNLCSTWTAERWSPEKSSTAETRREKKWMESTKRTKRRKMTTDNELRGVVVITN